MAKDTRKKAVALKYKPGVTSAPQVTAKGFGDVAEKIIQIAREHKVPIKEDPDLIETLSKLDLYQEIPPELYHVIAEVLAWVYKVNGRFGKTG
ncbi:MAG: EscU/YscU/HrcU family type III secretion system export apparatus switch protein [Nitrospinae bacterium]|nr:EscU/YscU/HrcU family type III secretion system export apparatus switch protein [Nitrospinota bacterium]